ncbi:MAG: hypothetical protein KAT15_24310, partial [Bacteroidales bacterium]|nr:hypothetical protein [Bacteroidales bacterium]
MKAFSYPFVFLILATAIPNAMSQPVIADSAEIILGAIRWDWTGDGEVNRAVEKSLGPQQWHYRVPFFGTILNDSTIQATCATQECVDREIVYAKENGLDYWAFLLYPEGSDLDLPLRRYLSSGYNSELNFAVIGADSLDRIIYYFKHPSYQTVLSGRPLYFIYDDFVPEHISDLKARCMMEGIPEPYVVPMKDTQEPGEDAISRYWYNGTNFAGETYGAPYSVLANSAIAEWNRRKEAGYTQVPLVSTGTDGRPRLINTPPWIQDPSFYEKYYEAPTPAELAENLQAAVDFVAANPVSCEAKAILIYSWNENDEGGWLTPTLDTSNSDLVDISRLRALKEVVWPTNPDNPAVQDAYLKAILVDGDTLPGFHPDTTHYQILLRGTNARVPVITALSREKYARINIILPDQPSGSAEILVTSEDGSTQKTYFLEIDVSYVPPGTIGWEFNSPFDTERWEVVWHGHASLQAPDTVLLVHIKDEYPEIRSPPDLQINAATYDKAVISVKNNTTSDDWYFKIYAGEGAEKLIDLIPSTMDNEFKNYSLDLSSVPEWQGTIDQVGWLVARQVGTGTAEIDYVRLELTDQPLSDDTFLDFIAYDDIHLESF